METRTRKPEDSPADWQAISADPNTGRVAASRRELLARARAQELVRDRVAYICSIATGKKVLDIGCVEHRASSAENPDWLHGRLAGVASECLGVDVLGEEVQALQEKGYLIRCHDVLKAPLDDRFEVIVCGELVEHLSSPGELFDSLASMLGADGEVIMTTPNPWYINVILKNLVGRASFVDSADHVAWFEPSVLFELSRRAGLRLVKFAGIEVERPVTLRARLFFALGPILRGLGFRRELFAKTIVYHFAPAQKAASV